MTFRIRTSRKNNFRVFHLSGTFDTQACFDLKESLVDPLKDEYYSICLDLTAVPHIDHSGFRFLENIQKNLERSGRSLVVFGAGAEILEVMKTQGMEKRVKHYQSLYEFESTFNAEEKKTRKKYYELAVPAGTVRKLALNCPLCQTEGLSGYFCDESQHEYLWEDSEITPQWRLKENPENQIDFELYEVAVCHKCFFSSCKLDHFIVSLPEGTIPSVLTHEQKEGLQKNSSHRSNALSSYQRQNAKSFFSMPRDGNAGYLSWLLYDKTVRDLAKDRAHTNSIEVARANILSAKYSSNKLDRNNAFTTAHVWLSDMINNPDGYTTSELVMGNIYLVSVSMAIDKMKEAKKIYQHFLEQYGNDGYFTFWTRRAKELAREFDSP
ncbi:STAS domain-containing protein [Fibrobacterota bacterium]